MLHKMRNIPCFKSLLTQDTSSKLRVYIYKDKIVLFWSASSVISLYKRWNIQLPILTTVRHWAASSNNWTCTGKAEHSCPIPQMIWFGEWGKTAIISPHTPQPFELASSETRGLPTRAYFGYPASRTVAPTAHNHSSSHPTKQKCKNGERETSAAAQVALKNTPYANIISEKHELVSSPRHCLVWRHSASPSPGLRKPHSSPQNPPPWLCTAKHPFTFGTSKKGQIPLSVSQRQPKGGFAAPCL